MHIVFVTIELATSENSSGGLASFTANMARIFASHGHKVSIILASTKEENLIFDSGINLYCSYIEMHKWQKFDKWAKMIARIYNDSQDEIRRTIINLYKSYNVKKTISKINKQEKIDIIHYCNHGSLNFMADKRIPYVVRISGFTNIWMEGANTENGSLEYKDNPLSTRGKLEEYTLKKSKYVISPSNLLANICKEDLGITPAVLESPFILSKTNWNYSIFEKECYEKKYILDYGTQSYYKGTYVVGQLVHKLLENYNELYLVLIGRDFEKISDSNGNELPPKEYVKKMAKEYGERVICIDKLVREDLYPFIENAELCLLPSRIENLSNACIESMAMGKIVVATNGASYEQLIDDGISGFLCERDIPESYLEAIEKVLHMNSTEKEIMSENAKNVTERLMPDKVYENYLEYYEKVIREWNR